MRPRARRPMGSPPGRCRCCQHPHVRHKPLNVECCPGAPNSLVCDGGKHHRGRVSSKLIAELSHSDSGTGSSRRQLNSRCLLYLVSRSPPAVYGAAHCSAANEPLACVGCGSGVIGPSANCCDMLTKFTQCSYCGRHSRDRCVVAVAQQINA